MFRKHCSPSCQSSLSLESLSSGILKGRGGRGKAEGRAKENKYGKSPRINGEKTGCKEESTESHVLKLAQGREGRDASGGNFPSKMYSLYLSDYFHHNDDCG